VSGPRPPAWEKIALISRLLADYDAVFWVDSDAIILDDSRDIIGEILPRKWLYLIKEKSATMGDHVNTGVLLILRNETSHRFLREVWRQRDLIYHMWWEQAATLRLLGYDLDPVRKVRPSPFDEGVHIIDTVWNSMPFDPVEQPRIRHYAGIPLEDRVRLMTEDNLRLGLQSTTSRNE
jgi:hypothetical protein